MMLLPVGYLNKEKVMLVLLLLIGIIGGACVFTPAYLSNLNVLIGFCLFPFALVTTGPARNNILHIIPITLFASLAVISKVRICYFFLLAFYFLWLIELFAGRLNVLILFLILFMSPFFIQVVTILGFPLRLMLSEYAGDVLNLAGLPVQVEGNTMTLKGEAFSVDEACMGLNMLVISLLMGVFVLAFRYRVSTTTLGLYSTTIFFAGAFILNMLTNLIRIVVLVFFRIPPENPMHEVVGILCLIVYAVLPLHVVGAWMVRRYGKSKNDSPSEPARSRSKIVCIVILPATILFVGAKLKKKPHVSHAAHADVHFGKIKPERLKDGISKLSTDDILIYVKTIPEFFTGEHTPLMCWRGSGYEFSGITTTTVGGVTIYKGSLVKEGKSLHTAWWYSNGQVETISQLDWRMRMLKGEPNFCLINVTTEDEPTLATSIKSMLTTTEFSIKVP